jgi:hypothetical protein
MHKNFSIFINLNNGKDVRIYIGEIPLLWTILYEFLFLCVRAAVVLSVLGRWTSSQYQQILSRSLSI